jgi:hypothetical protein
MLSTPTTRQAEAKADTYWLEMRLHFVEPLRRTLLGADDEDEAL